MKPNAITRSLSRLLGGPPDTATHDAKADRGTKNQLAMLIDTENIPAAQMNEIMSRAKQYGEITHRLAFGPTTNGNWAQTRLKHAIRWGRQSLVKTGKNSADIELSITAMELLLTDRSIGGFCIVSSDSDFTPLVMRLKEADKLVVGFGNQNAAAGFIAACDRFETLRGAQTKQPVSAEPRKEPAAQSAKPQSERKARRREFLDLVRRAAAKAKRHDGWINISELGSEIRKLNPGIKYKDYGHNKLILVLKSYPNEIETTGPVERKQIRLRDLGTAPA